MIARATKSICRIFPLQLFLSSSSSSFFFLLLLLYFIFIFISSNEIVVRGALRGGRGGSDWGLRAAVAAAGRRGGAAALATVALLQLGALQLQQLHLGLGRLLGGRHLGVRLAQLIVRAHERVVLVGQLLHLDLEIGHLLAQPLDGRVLLQNDRLLRLDRRVLRLLLLGQFLVSGKEQEEEEEEVKRKKRRRRRRKNIVTMNTQTNNNLFLPSLISISFLFSFSFFFFFLLLQAPRVRPRGSRRAAGSLRPSGTLGR